ncbi:MAG: hypothetical protein KME11_02170 [Timaviella obliquedivisa GSE-PSE-MK23-08B]|jgi:hypothetical protein|nr:hypothetical protein [Timaviella obliquedivisa GSE-PSE-MK23-08B]
MNSQKSLWGDLSKPDIVRTPFTILKEQAAILSEATDGLLVGDVRRIQNQEKQNIELRVVAPSLDNYRYSILSVIHDIKLYPLSLNNLANDTYHRQCDSEEAFEQALGEILSSPEVRKVISTLLSEINAGTDKLPF